MIFDYFILSVYNVICERVDFMFEKTKAFCDKLIEKGFPGIDLMVYHNGECVLRYMTGYRDVENKVKVNGNERYNIYSCSKVITCVAAMQLWEKGLFSLEDKLSDYMPEFGEMTVKTETGIKKAENPILIKHLFEMTAGFSYDTESEAVKQCRKDTDNKCPTREFMKYLAKEPLLFEPGERWEYSLSHDVLAAFVEVLSGEKFEDYVKNHIFNVAGMKNTTFVLPENELDTLAEQYRFADGKIVNTGKNITSYKFGSEYASGGAGCISSTEDYIKFLEALRKGELIKGESIDLMCTPRLNEKQQEDYWIKETHGYGLGIRCPYKNEKYNDFGWGGAACAYLAVDMKENVSLYFATHILGMPYSDHRAMVYRYIMAELFKTEEIESIEEDIRKIEERMITF